MFALKLSYKALKFYENCDKTVEKRLNRAFENLKRGIFGNNLKALKGEFEGSYRLRVGDLRIVFQIFQAERKIVVELIDFRKDVYRH